VKLTGCTLRLPSYIRLEQISRASHGVDPISMLLTAEQGGPTNGAGIGSVQGMLKQGKTETLPSLPVAEALHNAGRIRGIGVTDNPAFVGEGKVERQLGRDIKDNVIDGNVIVHGWQGAWFGVIRNTVGGNVMASNTVGTRIGDGNLPDSTEIVTNHISGNLICQGNSPAAQIGDSDGSPNTVGGNKIGECAAY
jgi:hypothetical protein